ncbi:putative iron/ascorbate oxido [Cyphellophora attinorum]|uniref:Putative iron/ascorbate oxido n=1 Tax=Cyphellophora attinorum TaxID=1664694 RepID=A0A0N1P135_9EURO|nr:putative iron/ascorbate oxido [Phialophora attinorum]KPI43057.1 putative iron/ascorbate oxido [Phialophora attinorum]
MASIPTIDISPYLRQQASADDKAAVKDAVKNACAKYGFFQLSGHGVPLTAQQAVIEASRRLFSLPQKQKDALSLKNSPARRGYERVGEQVLDINALPDFKEGYYVGREVPAKDMSFSRGPNQWPPPESLPDDHFRNPITEYWQYLVQLCDTMMEILTLGLGHDISVLQNFTREPAANLKLLHYPPHLSKDERQFGAGAHTDFGALTILLQQPGKHGLQVFDRSSGEWIAVPAVEDIFVVNIGDLIQKWTDGEYNSTVHRVVNISGGDRYSVPCFYQAR